MSIGKNLMVLVNILLFGGACFISGVCYNKNPDGNWAYFLIPPLILLVPNIFEIINGIGVYEDFPKSENEEKKKKKGKK